MSVMAPGKALECFALSSLPDMVPSPSESQRIAFSWARFDTSINPSLSAS